MRTARLGTEIHSPPTGPADPPTIVLISSLGSDRSMWTHQTSALSEEFRVVADDLRGHGDSDVPSGPYSIAELAADVLRVLDDHDVPRAHVVGLSIGGAIAQWIGIHHSDRVDSLTFLCTAPKFGDPARWRDRAATVRTEGVSAVADAIPGARFELHSPAAHVPAVELPERVTGLLQEHVRDVASRSRTGETE